MAKQASDPSKKKATGGAFANMEQSDKIKLIGASVVLVLAVVWIAYTLVGGGGDAPPKPDPTFVAEEAAKVEEVEKERVKREADDAARGRPKPPILGS